jgi:cell division protease FtsH
VGPPGTGKTLLARAVAGEAGVPFFSINGPEFVEMFVGVGAARVRDLFEQARTRAPAIIFIDELDALGRARGPFSFGGGHDEKEQTLNQLLSELDGFDPTSGLILLAATNRPEILDPALLRAGRFDRQVLVDRPDRSGRREILALYLAKVKCLREIDAATIAALTPGFTGADLANLVNEAALSATRRGAKGVELADFHAALERIVAGLPKRSRVLQPEEKRRVATHELGHAVVAMSLPGSEPVEKISIIPRGIAGLGYTMQRPGEDRFLVSRRELQAKMAVLLGGRAAEKLVFDDVSTGAADDLEKATAIARNMVTRFGMDEKIGNVTYAEPQRFLGPSPTAAGSVEASSATAADIDAAVRAFVEAAYQRALAIVKSHHLALERFSKRLLESETLEGADLTDLQHAIAGGEAPAAVPPPARALPS